MVQNWFRTNEGKHHIARYVIEAGRGSDGPFIGLEGETRYMLNLFIEQVSFRFHPMARRSDQTLAATVHNVSCKWLAGQVTSIMGPNGAGKTTLLKLAAGLLEPSQGDIRFDDADIDFADPSERARRIAYLPQFQSVVWPMAVGDVVALGRLPHTAGTISGVLPGFNRLDEDDVAAIHNAMVQANILKLKHRAIDTLSGGEQARVLLARALATQADIFLLDEPIQSLDPAGQLDVMNLLQALARQGKAVIISIHDMNLAARYSDQVVLMRAGRVQSSGPAQEVFTSENISSVFDVKIRSGSHQPINGNIAAILLDPIDD